MWLLSMRDTHPSNHNPLGFAGARLRPCKEATKRRGISDYRVERTAYPAKDGRGESKERDKIFRGPLWLGQDKFSCYDDSFDGAVFFSY